MPDTRRWTRPAALAGLAFLLAAQAAPAADLPLRVIVFGAHPDDCDMDAGGTAALWAAKGHQVKCVSVTNGDAGHQSEGGGALARRRRAEAQEAGRRLGIAEYEVLDNHDGELEPTLAVRQEVIRRIRRWNADVVIAPRPNDYHPDHRYTGVLVQDTAYMVMVPNVCPDTPPLRKNPVFLYSQDHFQRPNPFRPDVAVAIDSVIERRSTRSTPTCPRSTSGCPGWRASSTPCRRSPRRGSRGCASRGAAGRSARRCGRRCGSGTGRGPRR